MVNASADEVMFLWKNKPAITIGRHQNAWSECKLSELEKDGVDLARRHSGGGAVFQDPGCLTFTLISTAPASAMQDVISQNFELILRGLARAGVKAECKRSGRNDMTVVMPNEDEETKADMPEADYKFSGSAFKALQSKDGVGRIIHHGTLLFDTDFGALGRYLTPAKVKLESKGIKSVKARVRNLKQVAPNLTLAELQTALEQEFLLAKATGDKKEAHYEVIDQNTKSLTDLGFFQPFHDGLNNWDFRFGASPKFSHTIGPARINKSLDASQAWGTFEAHLEVESGAVVNGVLYSDCLVPDIITLMNDTLSGLKLAMDGAKDADKVTYSRTGLEIRYFEQIVLKASEQGITISEDNLQLLKDICGWIGEAVEDV